MEKFKSYLQVSKKAEDMQKIIEQVKNGGGALPAFKGTLSDQKIKDVATYVNQIIAPKG